MEPTQTFRARCVALPIENIDTDQIIPARYLKVTDKNGLGEALFTDWRSDPAFVLNRPEAQGAGVLVAGHNFGCGSSREHAPWALQGFGFKAVISTYFADIFKNNALKNGLLPIVVDPETLLQLTSLCEEDPTTTITVDLANQQIVINDSQTVGFPIDAFSKHCLLHGVDQLGYLQDQEAAISAYEGANPQRVNTSSL
ncbi:MAG: 3-isopropylmalate dehydratase small subunit [Herpetosiphonaceae bacterium]|nr:3-isopropylmalate dehydratase small subunit [Herpetosiphonaceae bacterium]